MKNYKYVVPLLLVGFMALSIYSIVSASQQEGVDYAGYLEEAQEFRQDEIVEDAEEAYLNALKINYNIDVALEVGSLYEENNMDDKAINWGEILIDKFPKEPKAYTFLLKQLYEKEDYEECFSLYEQADSRQVVNEEFESMIHTIKYVYEINFDDYEEVSMFSDGYCAVFTEGKWGYINSIGDLTVPCIYTQADTYFDDYAAVQDEQNEWFYINTEGNKKKVVKNLESCTYLGAFYDDKLVACDGKEYAYYNKDFEKLSNSYAYASALNGDIGAVEKDGKWSLVNSQGEVFTTNEYDKIVLDEKKIAYRSKRAFGKRDGLYYMIDENGQEIKTEALQDAKLFLPEANFTAVEVGNKWGFIDLNGNMVIEPKYQDARPFSHELAAVKENGKWGFIDAEGNMVIEPQFTEAKDFNTRGCVFVSQGSGWSLLKLYKDNH